MERNVSRDERDPAELSPDDGGLPWYVKVALAVVILVILFVVGIDLLEFVTA